MILLIRTNETAENIAVFYYGGHGFGKKSGFWRPHVVVGVLCVMWLRNVFCALCAGGALVRGEIGRRRIFCGLRRMAGRATDCLMEVCVVWRFILYRVVPRLRQIL